METEQNKVEQSIWIDWLKKRIKLTALEEEYVRFALRELQAHNAALQEENKRLNENYDHSQRVLDSYRKLLEEEKSRTEELEKLLKLERQSNPNKAPF